MQKGNFKRLPKTTLKLLSVDKICYKMALLSQCFCHKLADKNGARTAHTYNILLWSGIPQMSQVNSLAN